MKAGFALVNLVLLMLSLSPACCRAATAGDDEPSQSRGITVLLNYHNLAECDNEQQAWLLALKAAVSFKASETIDAVVARRYITVSNELPTWPQRPLDFAPDFTGTIRVELHSCDDPGFKPRKVTQVETKPQLSQEPSLTGDLHRLGSALWAW